MAAIQITEQAMQTETTRPQLITVVILAGMLGISPRSVWRRLSCGEMIQPVRIGRSVRWRLRDVEIWVAAGCPTPVSDWNGR